MTFNSLIAFTGAVFCGGLAVLVLFRDRHSFVHRTFAIGMLALAVEGFLGGMSFVAVTPEEIIKWQRLRFVPTAFLPSIWLFFVITFGRSDYKEFLKNYKWVVIGGIIFSISVVTILGANLDFHPVNLGNPSSWSIRLGFSGSIFYIFFLLGAVLILMSLEKTLRQSSGIMRWKVKFMILGIGSIFAFRIYTGSQSLLFSSISSSLEVANVATVIIGNVMISIALFRLPVLNIDIYFSQKFIYNSFVVLMVGIYLILVGILAKVVEYLGVGHDLPLEALFLFLMLLGLTGFMLSDGARQRVKEFISRHLKRPQYDYRREWREFTRRTTSLMDLKSLSAVVARMIADTFGVSSVSVWVLDGGKKNFALAGSTAFSSHRTKGLKIPEKAASQILLAMQQQSIPEDIHQSEKDWVIDFKAKNSEIFRESQTRYFLPIAMGENLLGLLTFNDRITDRPFSMEDFDLLKTIADQVAAHLLNLKLGEEVQQRKEMEAFQTMSAFFIHDLKNLASTLSLTVQNLPVHFESPEFRQDAIKAISQGLEKINGMTSRLRSLNQPFDLQRMETDVNELVKSTLSSLDRCLKTSITSVIRPIPKIHVDPGQIQKVIVNLLLNANEAIGEKGTIKIATMQENGYAVLSVEDTGCGMSHEFIENLLFRPFKTTKKQGMGIGLYQSKKIIEAHQGRIEVESEEGKGTTLRVLLPLNRV